MFRTTKPYYITMGIAVLLMVITLIVTSMMGSSVKSELQQQEQTIQTLQNEIAAKSAAISSGNANAVSDTMGIQIDRVNTDDEIARRFIEKMTTWTNYDEYTTARFELIQEYGLQTNSTLLRTFMPEYPDTYDKEGNAYNFIDYNKLSCSFKGMKSMVRGIQDDVYSYFTIVTCTGIKNGAGSDFNIAVLYSVDGNGTLSNFDAYTLDGHVWVN